jgi:GT2 family glycosyltransferase
LENSINHFPVRVLAVIVLYKMPPSESNALRTLRAAISALPPGRQADIKILLYDNTPGGQDAGALPTEVQYKADVQNGGLAKAYNYALEIASEEVFDWLLTLDQDTSLSIDFLHKLCHSLAFVEPLKNVAAIVPLISEKGKILSPSDRNFGKRRQRFSDGFIGIPSVTVYAANSASTFRVSALKSLGGYDPRFSVWASDLVLYRRLYEHHFRVFVAGNIHVEHEVSVFDLENRSTANRYKDMLRAEEAFYDEYMVGEHLTLLLIMFRRLVYELPRIGGTLPYYQIAFRFLCRSLFYSRKHRMKSWEQSVSRG